MDNGVSGSSGVAVLLPVGLASNPDLVFVTTLHPSMVEPPALVTATRELLAKMQIVNQVRFDFGNILFIRITTSTFCPNYQFLQANN